jgi:chromosome segregation ATPase
MLSGYQTLIIQGLRKMSDKERKDDSWIGKIPKIIAVLLVLIFIIIVFSEHNKYKKWKAEESELTGRIKQTSEELELLKEANGSLQEVTEKVEYLEQHAADMTATLDKLNAEKNNTDTVLAKLQQELKHFSGQVAASRNEVEKLTKEAESLRRTNQQLRADIVSKRNIIDSISFLQRQKALHEQNIQDLKTRYDQLTKEELEQQDRLSSLQHKIKEGEAAIQVQNERLAALNNELSELTETIKEMSNQKEKLTILDDHQKRLEYLEYLQLQKESLETSIKNLLEQGKMLEEQNLKLQQGSQPPD